MSLTGIMTGEFIVPVATGESSPDALVRGPDGNMWFGDALQNAIGRISSSGTVKEFKLPSPAEPVFGPRSLAVGGDGNIWFTASYGSGDVIGHLTTTGSNMGETALPAGHRAADLAAGPDGSMWFTDPESDQIGHIAVDGATTEYPIPGSRYPISVVRGAQGYVWFTAVPGSLGRVTSSGEITIFPVPGFLEEDGTTAGPEGDVWFGEDGGELGRITPSGELTRFAGAGVVGIQTGLLMFGSEGNLWYSPQFGEIDRLTTPLAPMAESLPSITGESVVGGALTISHGGWAHQPINFSDQWESCDAAGGSCEVISGATGATLMLTAGMASRTLRVAVTASNLGGTTTVISDASSAVRVPSPPAPSAPKPLLEPVTARKVGAFMTWRFAWSRRYTLVEVLTLERLPAGAIVEIECRGGGCPFRVRRTTTAVAGRRVCHGHICHRAHARFRSEIALADLFRGRRLEPGNRIDVDVIHSGWIGKTFAFSIRKNKAPRVDIGCLTPRATREASRC